MTFIEAHFSIGEKPRMTLLTASWCLRFHFCFGTADYSNRDHRKTNSKNQAALKPWPYPPETPSTVKRVPSAASKAPIGLSGSVESRATMLSELPASHAKNGVLMVRFRALLNLEFCL